MAVVRRFLRPPAGGFFLFGPRGTGKSTWLAEDFHGAVRLDLLAPDVLRADQAFQPCHHHRRDSSAKSRSGHPA
ncbi:MAG: hypothetical protein VKM34_00015 [Cyanobacteriota bacterium]|nr:hypothetical protein [Cyanobacteriota bacterium]